MKKDKRSLLQIKGNLPKFNKKIIKKVIFVILTLFVVGFLGYRFRDKFLAGMVNGRPVFRYELTGRLYSQYGRVVLEDLIVDKLISQEAGKKGMTVSRQELDEGIAKIKQQLGDKADLDSLLSLQGIKKSDFEHQLETQILVKKILVKEISVTDEEISTYIQENRKLMTATAEADLKVEAGERLMEKKISEQVNSWVSGLLEKAKILRFVK